VRENAKPTGDDANLASRTEDTLELMHDWGYAPGLPVLSAELLGGSVSISALERSLLSSSRFRFQDGYVALPGYESLLEKSKYRAATHRALNGQARGVAERFARDLASLCPYVQCVALSGSIASGGYDLGDDIDFDLFVRPGTKYISYLVSILLGLRYSWQYRKAEGPGLRKIAGFPKVTCVNVVWTQDQTKPFVRQDASMAFELLHCQPLVGASVFSRVVEDNGWLETYFPQLIGRVHADTVQRSDSWLSRVFARIERQPNVLEFLERISRATAWIIYTFAQTRWGRSPTTRARMEFLKRVKYPYEVFQD